MAHDVTMAHDVVYERLIQSQTDLIRPREPISALRSMSCAV